MSNAQLNQEYFQNSLDDQYSPDTQDNLNTQYNSQIQWNDPQNNQQELQDSYSAKITLGKSACWVSKNDSWILMAKTASTKRYWDQIGLKPPHCYSTMRHIILEIQIENDPKIEISELSVLYQDQSELLHAAHCFEEKQTNYIVDFQISPAKRPQGYHFYFCCNKANTKSSLYKTKNAFY